MTQAPTDTSRPPCPIKWFTFKEREWMNPAEFEEPTTPKYPGISQDINTIWRVKRARFQDAYIPDDDIVMYDSWLHDTQEPEANDENLHGDNGRESPPTVRPLKRMRFSEPLDQPSMARQVVNSDGNDDDVEDKENICPIPKRTNKGVVFGDRRKRTPLGTHKPEGYLDIFSNVKATNTSSKEIINRQWKVLDDRVNRTLRHFRGYHREHSDWEYEI